MSLNVLVVDDSPVMRRMVRRSLGMSGLAVGEVHTITKINAVTGATSPVRRP